MLRIARPSPPAFRLAAPALLSPLLRLFHKNLPISVALTKTAIRAPLQLRVLEIFGSLELCRHSLRVL